VPAPSSSKQHGARATEPWGYGDVSLAAIKKAMAVREELKDYIMAAMVEVSRTGPYPSLCIALSLS
jgi:alpha-glucosidase (family GH31 glycosyl hydrolase)